MLYSYDRAKLFIEKYGFDFNNINKFEIINLINKEFENYKNFEDYAIEGSEYIVILCGYLFCLGDISGIELLNKVKYNMNFDIQCMIDSDWIYSLENKNYNKNELIQEFIDNCINYYDIKN